MAQNNQAAVFELSGPPYNSYAMDNVDARVPQFANGSLNMVDSGYPPNGGGQWGRRRVCTDDQVKASDINELREIIEWIGGMDHNHDNLYGVPVWSQLGALEGFEPSDAISWANGSGMGSSGRPPIDIPGGAGGADVGQRKRVTGADLIMASDINELRSYAEKLEAHVHHPVANTVIDESSEEGVDINPINFTASLYGNRSFLNPVGSPTNWSNGSTTGGIFFLKRVTAADKVKMHDINELRSRLEGMRSHSHSGLAYDIDF